MNQCEANYSSVNKYNTSGWEICKYKTSGQKRGNRLLCPSSISVYPSWFHIYRHSSVDRRVAASNYRINLSSSTWPLRCSNCEPRLPVTTLSCVCEKYILIKGNAGGYVECKPTVSASLAISGSHGKPRTTTTSSVHRRIVQGRIEEAEKTTK